MIIHNKQSRPDNENDDLELLLNLKANHTSKEDLVHLLQLMPDDYALVSELKKFGLDGMVKVSEKMLAMNVKGYSAWYYREWVMRKCAGSCREKMPDEAKGRQTCDDWWDGAKLTTIIGNTSKKEQTAPEERRELLLIRQLLVYDSRNFHCWKYLLSMNKTTEFATFCLKNDIQNYSALHYVRDHGLTYWNGLVEAQNEGMFYKMKYPKAFRMRIVRSESGYDFAFLFRELFYGSILWEGRSLTLNGEIFYEIKNVSTDRVYTQLKCDKWSYSGWLQWGHGDCGDVNVIVEGPCMGCDERIAGEPCSCKKKSNGVSSGGNWKGIRGERSNFKQQKHESESSSCSCDDHIITAVYEKEKVVLNDLKGTNRFLLVRLLECMRCHRAMMKNKLKELDGMRKNFYEIINWWEVDVHDGLQYNRRNKQ